MEVLRRRFQIVAYKYLPENKFCDVKHIIQTQYSTACSWMQYKCEHK